MKIRPVTLLLLPSTVVFCYIVALMGQGVPIFYLHTYSPKSLDEARAFMPGITRLAADYAWIFDSSLALIALMVFVSLYWRPGLILRTTIIALCGQAIIVWIAMFCFFYEAFTRFSIRSGTTFEFQQFLTVYFGIFPLTLGAILVPLVVAVVYKE